MTAPPPASARFLVLDGVDGCGKTTQATRLVAALGEGGREVVHAREPGSTALGEALRGILLESGDALDAGVEALLFVAARRQLLGELVAPALARGAHVVCERFHAATFAYQAVAGGLDTDAVLALLSTWAGAPAPDLTLVLDLDLERAAERRSRVADRIEERDERFHARVARGFREWAERSARVRLVDGAGTTDAVFARVMDEVRRVL